MRKVIFNPLKNIDMNKERQGLKFAPNFDTKPVLDKYHKEGWQMVFIEVDFDGRTTMLLER